MGRDDLLHLAVSPLDVAGQGRVVRADDPLHAAPLAAGAACGRPGSTAE